MDPKPSYRLMGIDPGTNVLGYAILEVKGKKLKVIEIGVVKMSHLTNHQQKLKRIFESLTKLIKLHKPKHMAIEAPFYGKNVQSMLKLGRAQGVSIAAAMTNDVDITEYAPKKIKVSVTGNGNASKEQVAAMLESILKIKLLDFDLDATDALATALCHFYQAGKGGIAKKQYSGWGAYLKDNPGKKA